MSQHSRLVATLGTVATLVICCPGVAAALDFAIAQDTVANELLSLSAQTGRGIVFDRPLPQPGNAVEGHYTLEQAIAIVLGTSGLVCERVAANSSFVIRQTNDYRRHDGCVQPGTHLSASAAGSGTTSVGQAIMEEVHVVWSPVGTHFHNLPQIGSAVLTWDAQQIRLSGARDLPELLERATQNFRGGPGQQTHFGQAETLTNSGLGVGLNLRGLGSRATLVLLNGRRIAPSGNAASFVDILNIPLSAVERVEVLLDGASAIYGSDAVGGVINIYTRTDFAGPETLVEFGSVTDGRQEQHRLGQELGTHWGSGDFLVTAEVMHRGALSASSRSQNSSLIAGLNPTDNAVFSNPGNLVTAQGTYPIPRGQAGRYLDFNSLTAGSPNMQDLYAGEDIVPNQTRYSMLASVHQSMGSPTTVLFSDILWNHRFALERQGGQDLPIDVTHSPFLVNAPAGPITEEYNLLYDLGPQLTTVAVDTLNATWGLQMDLPGTWKLLVTGSGVLETEHQLTSGQANPLGLQNALDNVDPGSAFDPLGTGSNTAAMTLTAIRAQPQWYDSRSRLWDFAATADGEFLSLPGGPVHEALGFEFRDQHLAMSVSQTRSASGPRRVMYAGFAEIATPILSPTLTASLAGRVESYSDFGMAATPRLAVSWQPVNYLSVRGSWAKSVRAPNLGDLVERDNTTYIQVLGGIPTLVWTGGNAGLHAERALTRTAGAEYKDSAFSASLGYFDILFRDRIQMSAFPADVFASSSVVTLNPSESERASVCARSAFFGGAPEDCVNSAIGALVDLREHNSATLWTDGVDFSLASGLGPWSAGLKGTYILHYRQRDDSSSPFVSLLNTLSNPLALHLIGSVGFDLRPFKANIEVFYSNGYRDTETVPTTHVASWTTADFRAAYTCGSSLEAALRVENVFNRYAPFALNNVASLGYDQENGALTGRVVSVSLSYQW